MDMYSKLPDSIKVSATSKRKGKGKQEVIDDFLSECIPAKRVASGDTNLQHKVQMLDSVKKTWSRLAQTRRRNILSSREKKELKLFDIKQDGHKFENYLPVHSLWQDYMRDILDFQRLCLPDKGRMKDNQERMLKADYHGCMIVVKKTKCPSLLGMSGIVLMETRNTFKIITKNDQIKCIPKANSIFAFEIDNFVFTIHGNHFKVKTGERMRRKFKMKATVDM